MFNVPIDRHNTVQSLDLNERYGRISNSYKKMLEKKFDILYDLTEAQQKLLVKYEDDLKENILKK